MLLAVVAIVLGFAIIIYSAGHFVDGASALAVHLGVPRLLIGMIVVGFGTAAPELSVSFMAAFEGNPGLAIGNSVGSNITNMTLILGVASVLAPLPISSTLIWRELPLLLLATICAGIQLYFHPLGTTGTILLLVAIFGLALQRGRAGLAKGQQQIAENKIQGTHVHADKEWAPSIAYTLGGLVFLLLSSRIVVWGAVTLAQQLGIEDLIIGLTIMAVGTSLPELASAIIAGRKGQHDIALGNVIGSNMFNTIAMIAIAGIFDVGKLDPLAISRDWALMFVIVSILWIKGILSKKAEIGKGFGVGLLTVYATYMTYLIQ